MLATKTEVKMSSQSASGRNGTICRQLSAVQHPIVGTEIFQNDVNEFLGAVCTENVQIGPNRVTLCCLPSLFKVL